MAGPLKQYEVEVSGTTTTLLLNDEDAKARGLKVETKAAPAPDAKQAPAPRNKARKAANKSRGTQA